jgi:hypothetical protein
MKHGRGVLCGLMLVGIAGLGNTKESSPASGIWTFDKAVCPGTCSAGYQQKIQSLKGKRLVIQVDRYVSPIEGFQSECKTGVDFHSLKPQPGSDFVRKLPVEAESSRAHNDFDPSKLGVSDQKILAGVIACRDDGNLATLFMPKDDQLDLYLEGGVIAIFKKGSISKVE